MCRHCYSQHNNYTYYTYITLNLKKLFIFKWRVIALQCCAGFIQKHQAATSVHMSPSSLTSQPPPTPSHLSRLSQSPRLSPFCYTANSHFLSSLGLAMYMFPCSSVSSSHLLMSVLYVCISIATLKIGSSMSYFKIPYICINIWYLFFSFRLTSLCITGPTFIHLTTLT